MAKIREWPVRLFTWVVYGQKPCGLYALTLVTLTNLTNCLNKGSGVYADHSLSDSHKRYEQHFGCSHPFRAKFLHSLMRCWVYTGGECLASA